MTQDLTRRAFVGASAAIVGSAIAPRTASATGIAPGSPFRRAWQPSDELIDRLPTLMRLADVPAVSIAIVEEGAVTWARAFGVRNAETGEPADASTFFEAASLSKPTVAFVAMRLRDEGRLDIDRPLVDFVEPGHLLDDPRARRITARHVMGQSSGLKNWRRPNDEEFVLDFDPGTRYQYSGEGFVWLARVLENITGTGFVRLMRERLFDPLRLEATFLWSPALAPRMATGHNQAGSPTVNGMHTTMARAHYEAAATVGKAPEDWTWDDLVESARAARPDRPPMPGGLVPNAAASLLTTASDYARFTACMLDGPPVPSLLDERSRRMMVTPGTDVEPPLSWGLGIALEEHDGQRYLWHWGNNGDFHTFVLGDIAGRRALVVLTNANHGPRVYERVIRDIAGFDPASLVWI